MSLYHAVKPGLRASFHDSRKRLWTSLCARIEYPLLLRNA